MTEYVDKLKHVSQGNTANCPVKTDRSLLQLEREDGVAAVRPQLLINSSHETTEKKCVTADNVRSQAPQSKGGFGGMKKGFFGGGGGMSVCVWGCVELDIISIAWFRSKERSREEEETRIS